MSRNSGKRGTGGSELIERLEQALRQALPDTWRLDTRTTSRNLGFDIAFELAAPDGNTGVVLVETKSTVEPRDVSLVAAQVRRLGAEAGDTVILASSFVSPLTRDRLADAGLGWFDTVGNLRLRLDRPSVVIEQVGAARNPYSDPTDRRLKTLRGPGSARIVRALCEADLPMGVRTLAARSEVSAATSARVLDLLDRDAVISRAERGEVLAVRKRSLLRRWTEDYGLSTSNEVTSAIDPRGLDHALAVIRASGERYAATGSAAQRAYLPSSVIPVAPLTTLIVHAEDPRVLMREVGLPQTERGANVLVVRPMDSVVFENCRVHDGLTCVAPGQAAADLLTGPGRSPDEAAQLLDALAAADASWAE